MCVLVWELLTRHWISIINILVLILHVCIQLLQHLSMKLKSSFFWTNQLFLKHRQWFCPFLKTLLGIPVEPVLAVFLTEPLHYVAGKAKLPVSYIAWGTKFYDISYKICRDISKIFQGQSNNPTFPLSSNGIKCRVLTKLLTKAWRFYCCWKS